jgi:hypothetical protein
MAEKPEIKVTKTYSLDPIVIAWVTQKAARLTLENEGERASDSKVVNDILTTAMEADLRNQVAEMPARRQRNTAKAIAA